MPRTLTHPCSLSYLTEDVAQCWHSLYVYLYAGLRCGESGRYHVPTQELLVEAISHASFCWWSPMPDLFDAIMLMCTSCAHCTCLAPWAI